MTRPLSILEQSILVALRSEPRSLRDLGDAIGEPSQTTLVDLMLPLDDGGLIAWRDGNPGNSRYGLTPAGAEYLAEHGVKVGRDAIPR